MANVDAVRRLSGANAGCSRPAAFQASHRAHVGRQHCRSRRQLQRKLTRMLAVGAGALPYVRIVTKDSLRVKRILAEISVQASVEQVWSVLTNYNSLAEFVPNLDLCERVAGAPPGRQRLRQRACSQGVYWRLQAEAVLDVQEVVGTMGRRELRFTMVEGDFQEFSGRWVLEPDPTVQDGVSRATVLRYEVSIVPKWSLPSTIITTVVRCGLPANVRAVAARAEQLAQRRRTAPKLAKAAFADEPIGDAWARIPRAQTGGGAATGGEEEVLPAKGPARATPAFAEESRRRVLRVGSPQGYLGVASVPLPFPVAEQTTSKSWERVLPWKAVQKQQHRDSEPPETTGQEVDGTAHGIEGDHAADPPMDRSVEVHLRRLDTPLKLHRRAVASTEIDASPQEVWDVLTDYERIPEFVPNIVESSRLETPEGAPERLIRLRQVGYKSMMYMDLYAEATLALVENPLKEIQFKQLVGDFQLLQGKLILQDNSSHPDAPWMVGRAGTTLKYAVEVEIPRATAMIGLVESLLERVVYQDIPANLGAVKRRVEALREAARKQADGRMGAADDKPSQQALDSDFQVLQDELIRTFGESGPLPKRSSFRGMKRLDLRQAVQAHGGPQAVADRMGWASETPVRDVSPWVDLDSTRDAFDAFAAEEGLPREMLPSLGMLQRAGRRDMIHGAEQWGGLEELGELLEYQVLEDYQSPADLERQAATAARVNELVSKRQSQRRNILEDFDALAQDLRESCGEDGPLPSSTELRAMRRSDLAKAVSIHGGGPEVARRMGWKMDYKPPGYWSDVENCRAAIDEFCAEMAVPQGVVPSVYSMQQAKRYDLHRAVRTWGGLSNLAQALGYEVSEGSKEKRGKLAGEAKGNGAKQASPRKKKSNTSNDIRTEIDSW